MQEEKKGNTIRSLRILYPFWVVIGIFSLIYVPSSLIETSDGLITSQNISDNIVLFRLGILGRLVTHLLGIVIPLFLYKLFKALDKDMSTLMLILALISVPISMYNEANQLIITEILDKPNEILDALSMYYQGVRISTLFWGLWLFPLGWLVYKTKSFPKLIGVSLLIAGFGYVMESLLKILIPDLTTMQGIFEILTFGELIFIIWLVIFGSRIKTNA